MRPQPQPVKDVLEAQGRRQTWVARTTGRTTHYVWAVVNGIQAPSPGFKADVAAALGLPETVLFRDEWLQAETAS